MSAKKHVFIRGVLSGLLLSVVGLVLFAGWSLVPVQQGASAVVRLNGAVSEASNDFVGLGIILGGAGLLILSGRRRRARGRQSSS
jgi:cytochrome b subunit of formate dehydrogenase